MASGPEALDEPERSVKELSRFIRDHSSRMGMVFLGAGSIMFLAYPVLYPECSLFLERYLSPDHDIEPVTERLLTSSYFLIAVLSVISGSFLRGWIHQDIRSATRRILLDDPVCPSCSVRISPWVALLSSLSIGVLLSGLHVLDYILGRSAPSLRFLFREDGLFETLTAVALVISSVFMGRAVLVLRAKHRTRSPHRWILRVYVLLMLGFFLVAMEEVSWGQRLFGWETPGSLFEFNFQNETNLHCFLPRNIYPLLNHSISLILLLSVLIAGWSEFRKKSLLSRLVLPHPSMIGLACLITVLSPISGELLEVLISLFALFYSFRIFSCVNSRNPNLNS